MLKIAGCNHDSIFMIIFYRLNFTFAPVKIILGYIMTFLVLAFSVLPCADDASFAKGEVKYELSQTMPQNNDQNHDDACSPFCICSCCAGFSVVNKLPTSIAIAIPHQLTHSSYISERLYSIALSIWQPPQLV